MALMTATEIAVRVDAIFLEQFELDPQTLRPEANVFSDLGLDSLDAIDLVISFQREFRIKPSNEELQAIRTLQDVYSLVHRYYVALGDDAPHAVVAAVAAGGVATLP